MHRTSCTTLVGWCLLLLCICAVSQPAFAEDPPDLPRVVTHDNLQSAGQLQDGVLTLRLDLREAAWHPDADSGPYLPVYAFGAEGDAPMIPGPMIRVPEGTKIHVFVHNRLIFPAVVHGLVPHPSDHKDGLKVPPGETRDVTFSSGAAGTYYYWATTGDRDPGIDEREPWDTQLDGAFVVDPPGARVDDRIMVIGLWYRFLVPFDFDHGAHEVLTINGKSWPHTTRLTYRVGETARWRVINPSVGTHPMHLHGAYYLVDSVGDGERDNIYAPDQRRLVVTENMKEGSTMTLTWSPENEGDWVFHCHIAAHFDGRLADSVAAVMGSGTHQSGHEHVGMAGLVVGVHVLPSSKAQTQVAAGPVRRITMTLEPRPATASGRACFSVALDDGREHQVTAAGTELGPPLVLYRDQPSEITIVNHLGSPTAIHWHGMELESYYDGVPGVSGDSRGVTPPVAPGTSFVARMTPPRAGTFIYHTHWHDVNQLTSGLYGPLIVLEPGQKYDPAIDKVFFMSMRGDQASLLNGSDTPAPEQWSVGTKYRLRLINITPNNNGMVLSLLDGNMPVQWLPVGKDGADLPPAQRVVRQAKQRVGVGETYDFQYQPAQPGNLTVDLLRPFDKAHVRIPVVVTGQQAAASKP